MKVYSTYEYGEEISGRFRAEKQSRKNEDKQKRYRELLASVVDSLQNGKDPQEVANAILDTMDGNFRKRFK
jgi:flagellar motor component MotA